MANELTKIEPLHLPDLARPDRMPSLPAWVASRTASVREVTQNDGSGNHRRMPVLPKTMMLGSSERQQIEAYVGALRRSIDRTPDNSADAEAETLVLIGKLMLALPGQRASEAGAEAVGEAYQIAVGDLPPWSVSAALRRWYRRDAPPDKVPHDYRWRPAPAILRTIAFEEMLKVRGRAVELDRLLAAVPLIEYSPEHTVEMQAKLAAASPILSTIIHDARMRRAKELGAEADRLSEAAE